MTTAEITAYLYGVQYANQPGVVTISLTPGAMFDPGRLPQQEYNAYRHLGQDDFTKWMIRGAGDAYRA